MLGFLILVALVLAAAIVRGYAGFAFTAVVVTAGSLWRPVHELLPMAIVLEIVASVAMLPSVRTDVRPRILTSLLAGAALMIPVGQYLLLTIDANHARLIVYLLIAALCSLSLARPTRARLSANTPTLFVTGLVAGVAAGVAGLLGLVISAILLLTPLAIAELRSTLVVLILVSDIYSTVVGSINGLITTHTLSLSAAMIIPLIVGVVLGQRLFARFQTRHYRKAVSVLLIAIAGAGVARLCWR